MSLTSGVAVWQMARSSAAPGVFDVNGAGLQELDGNVCGDTANSAPPWDWANQNCDGSTLTKTVGLFNKDFSQTTPLSDASGRTIADSIICNDSTSTSSCLQGAATAGQALTNDLAFISGSSKDPIDPNGNWKCTTKPVTPKDEIDNAYASIGTAPVSIGGGAPSTHVILHMALERGVVNGTSNAGFWIMQNNVSCSPGANGTGTFTGGHKNGDLLVFATFNPGGAKCPNGTTSTACVSVFSWNNGNLSVTPVLTGFACTVQQGDTCGMTNTASVQTPWPPHNTAANALLPDGFFEVGVDLTDFYNGLGQTVPCLSTFLADTRASGSQGNAVNSDLHDYISGSFHNCNATIATQAGGATKVNTIQLGQSITDQATVSGTPGFPNPTGTVTFGVCGPITGTLSSTGNCTTKTPGFTPLDTKPLNSASPPVATSDPFQPPKAGTYCFDATYNGDSNYTNPVEEGGSSPSECFVVTAASIQTTPNVGSNGTITLGSSVMDNATVTFTPPTSTFPGEPTGDVQFYVCGPTPIGTTPPACLPSDPTAMPLGDPTIAADGTAKSNPFTPKSPGIYCFYSKYSGDSIYPPSTENNTSRECFTAKPAPAVLASTVSLDDTVMVQQFSATAGKPTGAVTFSLFGPFTSAPASCSGPALKTVTKLPADETYDASGNGFWTAQVDVPATIASGQSLANPNNVWYAWGASFDPTVSGGNSNYASGSLGCTAELVELSYGTGSGFDITPAPAP
jgi:hypothetical protein